MRAFMGTRQAGPLRAVSSVRLTPVVAVGVRQPPLELPRPPLRWHPPRRWRGSTRAVVVVRARAWALIHRGWVAPPGLGVRPRASVGGWFGAETGVRGVEAQIGVRRSTPERPAPPTPAESPGAQHCHPP